MMKNYKTLGVIRKRLGKITISQDSTKSNKITERKNIYAEKQGPKIKKVDAKNTIVQKIKTKY